MAVDTKQGVKFDNTINLGHILTFLGFLVTIMAGWQQLDKRVVVLEESRKAQEVRDATQDVRTNEKMGEIKDTLGEIKRTIEKVSDRLEKRP